LIVVIRFCAWAERLFSLASECIDPQIHNLENDGGCRLIIPPPVKILTTHIVEKGKPLYAEPKKSTSNQ
jgi:hypothetical protein